MDMCSGEQENRRYTNNDILWTCMRLLLQWIKAWSTQSNTWWYFIRQWFSVWVMAPQGHSIFWVGHRKFTAWIKYIKFKIELEVPSSPLFPAAQKAKMYFIAFPTSYLVEFGFSWVPLLWKVRNRLDVVNRGDLTYHWPHCNRTFENLQVFIRTKERTECNANY
jgi:hypothetical protein